MAKVKWGKKIKPEPQVEIDMSSAKTISSSYYEGEISTQNMRLGFYFTETPFYYSLESQFTPIPGIQTRLN